MYIPAPTTIPLQQGHVGSLHAPSDCLTIASDNTPESRLRCHRLAWKFDNGIVCVVYYTKGILRSGIQKSSLDACIISHPRSGCKTQDRPQA